VTVVAHEETLAQRLKRLRKERQMSQRELATDRATAVYICRIERGDRVPSVPVLRELAEKLGVSAEYLETGCVCAVEGCEEPGVLSVETDLMLGTMGVRASFSVCSLHWVFATWGAEVRE
jgi:DNA-binding XRE family transcriptional regulator